MKRHPKPKVPASGQLLLEDNGPSEGWFIITEAGQVINQTMRAAASVAYFLRQHQLGLRVSNLDALGSQQLIDIAKTTVH